ncbi:MAG: ABC-F family ATP-binding cassette domain-containing protein, partial [Candidatus Dojkabacteria bacterium]
MILRTQDITFSFSDDPLFVDCSIQIDEGDKIALIGPNGSGKTTLLKILTGEITPHQGKIITKKNVKIGFQEQFRISDPEKTLWEELEECFSDIIKILENEHEIEHEHLAFEKNIRSILKGVGFSEDDWQRPLKSFSGGELTRISLSKLFLREYDLLILDEPTNHLDIASVYWLENFLKSYKGTILMVTHDRDLLKGVINQIFELNNSKIWSFRMSYENYCLQRERMIESKTKEKKKLENELERQKKVLRQYQKWIHMGNVKAISLMHTREKMVSRLEKKVDDIEIMTQEKTHIGDIPAPERSNYVVFECNELSKSFGDKIVFENCSFRILRSEKIVLLGKNGVGKSTLLKIMTGEIKPDGGSFHFGDKVRFAYLSQDLSKLLPENTIFEELSELMPLKFDYEINAYAGRFGFTGTDTQKKVAVLSGGEKLKLSLAKTLLNKPNLLILDEPTNHLDIMSIERLQEVLSEYEGSIIMVTHDRRLLNYVSDRILVLKETGINEIRSVNDYLLMMDNQGTFGENKSKGKNPNKSYEKHKILKNRLKKIEDYIDEIHENYLFLEREDKRIQNEMINPNNLQDY